MPLDSYGNRIGPGHEDIVRACVEQGKVIEILDKLEGSYEVEMMIEGNYDMTKMLLQPLFRRPKS